jgi:uncharacterized protein YijF (DUF1287 family)
MSKKVRALVLVIGAAIVIAALFVAVAWLKGNGLGGGAPENTVSSTSKVASSVTPMKPKLKSSVDANKNGTDDYTDFVAGARIVARQHPTYDDGYYQGGYPPAGRGACTDLIVEAFKNAGYDLKAMVDADIAAHPAEYPSVTKADPNIDYRRTGTLNQFFKLHALALTTNVKDTKQWQQGDIVVFETTRHIGMVGDTRDTQGIAYFIHNNHQSGPFEEDFLAHTKLKITGHYRFDASKMPASVIKKSRS